MAKVTGPLMSIEATGKFADSIVFDRRGFARGYTIPSNPRTEDQQATRLAMKAAQTAAKRLNTETREKLRQAYGYRWNAKLLSAALGANLENYNAAMTEFALIPTGTDLDALTDAAADARVPDTSVPESEEVVTGAQAIYVILKAYNNLITPAIPTAECGTLFTQ